MSGMRACAHRPTVLQEQTVCSAVLPGPGTAALAGPGLMRACRASLPIVVNPGPERPAAGMLAGASGALASYGLAAWHAGTVFQERVLPTTNWRHPPSSLPGSDFSRAPHSCLAPRRARSDPRRLPFLKDRDPQQLGYLESIERPALAVQARCWTIMGQWTCGGCPGAGERARCPHEGGCALYFRPGTSGTPYANTDMEPA